MKAAHDKLLIETVARLRAGAMAEAALASSLGCAAGESAGLLAELRGLGYGFHVDSGQVELTVSPDCMIDTEIRAGLKTRVFAHEVHCYGRIRSTNLCAHELAEQGAPEGTVVVAEEQTGGVGRFGRVWHSAPGLGIWSTVILRPPGTAGRASGLSLLAGVVFARTVEAELGLDVALKWPNDGLIDGRKVIGILTELATESGEIEYAICGTGINVAHTVTDFPDDLRESATSLALAKGQPIDRMVFYRSFLMRFDALYTQFRTAGIAPFMDEYRSRSVLIGRDITVRQGKHAIAGRAMGIDDAGALIVHSEGKDILVYSGEATLRRPD